MRYVFGAVLIGFMAACAPQNGALPRAAEDNSAEIADRLIAEDPSLANDPVRLTALIAEEQGYEYDPDAPIIYD